MKTPINAIRKLGLAIIAVICLSLIVSCEYDVPITGAPTQKINDKLVGNWVSDNGEDTMKVRRFDDSAYVIVYNGQLFRAYHSDLDGKAFVSVEDVDLATRKYCYRVWDLSADGSGLTLHSINHRLVPRDIKDMALIRALLRKNLNNPELLNYEIHFNKKT